MLLRGDTTVQRATEDKMNEGLKYRAHLGSSPGTKQSSFRPRTINDKASSRDKNGFDDSNRVCINNDKIHNSVLDYVLFL